MADPTIPQQQSDDALYFSNTTDTDLFNASEDPTGRTALQFRHHQGQASPRPAIGPAVPIPVVRLTPGAHTIP